MRISHHIECKYEVLVIVRFVCIGAPDGYLRFTPGVVRDIQEFEVGCFEVIDTLL
jgi:hypothetical protein